MESSDQDQENKRHSKTKEAYPDIQDLMFNKKLVSKDKKKKEYKKWLKRKNSR